MPSELFSSHVLSAAPVHLPPARDLSHSVEHSRGREGGAGPSPLLHLSNAGHDLDLHHLAAVHESGHLFLSFILHTEHGRVGVDDALPGGYVQAMALDVHHMCGGGGRDGCGDHCDQGVGGE